MLKNLTLTAAAIGVAFSVALPVATANASPLVVNPALLEDLELKPLQPPITCNAARNVIKSKGYTKVKKLECDGLTYTFKGKKSGKKYFLSINAITKNVSVM